MRGAGRQSRAEHSWGSLGTELWHWGHGLCGQGFCSDLGNNSISAAQLGTGGSFGEDALKQQLQPQLMCCECAIYRGALPHTAGLAGESTNTA